MREAKAKPCVKSARNRCEERFILVKSGLKAGFIRLKLGQTIMRLNDTCEINLKKI